jgi:hypothetical protein
MIIYNLNYSEYKIFNPTTGEVIVHHDCDDDASSLIAYWINGIIDEPLIKNEELNKAWETYVDKYKKDNDIYPGYEELYKFLEGYDNPEWLGFEITSNGIACGPVSFTVVYIVDKDVIVEELNE